MTDREKIAEFLRAWPTTIMHWDQGADAILALFEDTIKDAERWRKHQERKRVLIERGFLNTPLRGNAIDAAMKGAE